MGNKCSIQSPIKPLKQCAITSSALVALTLHNCQHLESFKMHCDELFEHGIKTAPMHIHAFDLNTFVHGFKGRGREGGWYSPTPKKINLKISHCKIIKNRHRTHSLANKIISRTPPPLRKMSGSEHDINILKEMTIGWAASLTWTITSNLHASLTHLFTPNGYSNLSDPYSYISVLQTILYSFIFTRIIYSTYFSENWFPTRPPGIRINFTKYCSVFFWIIVFSLF